MNNLAIARTSAPCLKARTPIVHRLAAPRPKLVVGTGETAATTHLRRAPQRAGIRRARAPTVRATPALLEPAVSLTARAAMCRTANAGTSAAIPTARTRFVRRRPANLSRLAAMIGGGVVMNNLAIARTSAPCLKARTPSVHRPSAPRLKPVVWTGEAAATTRLMRAPMTTAPRRARAPTVRATPALLEPAVSLTARALMRPVTSAGTQVATPRARTRIVRR